MRGQPGSVNLTISGQDLWAQSVRWEKTRCLHRRSWLSGPREAGFFLASGLNSANSALGQGGHVQVIHG